MRITEECVFLSQTHCTYPTTTLPHPYTPLERTPRPPQHHQQKFEMYVGMDASAMIHLCNGESIPFQTYTENLHSRSIEGAQIQISYCDQGSLTLYVWAGVSEQTVPVLFNLQAITLCTSLGVRRIMQVPWLRYCCVCFLFLFFLLSCSVLLFLLASAAAATCDKNKKKARGDRTRGC